MKLVVILLFSTLFFGCAQKNSMPTHKMFQSVDEKQAVLVQDGKEKRYCERCGMDLVKFYKTSHITEDSNGKKHQYCSIHCLEEHLGEGITLKNPKVVDVASLKFVDVTEVHYVVGSKVHGTMSRVSKYAFKNLDDAKKFQEKNGGQITDFSGALLKAKEDFLK